MPHSNNNNAADSVEPVDIMKTFASLKGIAKDLRVLWNFKKRVIRYKKMKEDEKRCEDCANREEDCMVTCVWCGCVYCDDCAVCVGGEEHEDFANWICPNCADVKDLE